MHVEAREACCKGGHGKQSKRSVWFLALGVEMPVRPSCRCEHVSLRSELRQIHDRKANCAGMVRGNRLRRQGNQSSNPREHCLLKNRRLKIEIAWRMEEPGEY